MTRIRVNPELPTWARERDGLESLALAARFPKLCEWEAGELKPTLCQLEDFARAVHVAVDYLFLPAARRRALCRVHAEPHSGGRRQCHPQVAPQVTPQVERLLLAIQGDMGREALQDALGLQDRKSFRARYLKPALEHGLIEMTIPGKPNSRLQQYRLTDKGRQWLLQRKGR